MSHSSASWCVQATTFHISLLVLIVEHARLQRSLWFCQQCYLPRVLHFSAIHYTGVEKQCTNVLTVGCNAHTSQAVAWSIVTCTSAQTHTPTYFTVVWSYVYMHTQKHTHSLTRSPTHPHSLSPTEQLTAGREEGVATIAVGPRGDPDSRPSRTARERTGAREMKVQYMCNPIQLEP